MTLVKVKDDLLESLSKSSEKLLDEKDKRLDEKDKRLHEKDSLIRSLQAQLLSTRGLLNTRGILEHYLWYCYLELKDLKILSDKETFVVSNFVQKLHTQPSIVPSNALITREFLEKIKDCGCGNLKVMYSELSSQIHGMPWCGPSVDVYANEMSPQQKCVVEFIAAKLKLNLKEVVMPKSEYTFAT